MRTLCVTPTLASRSVFLSFGMSRQCRHISSVFLGITTTRIITHKSAPQYEEDTLPILPRPFRRQAAWRNSKLYPPRLMWPISVSNVNCTWKLPGNCSWCDAVALPFPVGCEQSPPLPALALSSRPAPSEKPVRHPRSLGLCAAWPSVRWSSIRFLRRLALETIRPRERPSTRLSR